MNISKFVDGSIQKQSIEKLRNVRDRQQSSERATERERAREVYTEECIREHNQLDLTSSHVGL